MPNKTKGILRAHQSLISLAHRLSDILVIVLTGVVLLSAGSGVLDAQLWVSVLLCVMLFHWLGELNQLYGSWRGESLLRESLSVTLYWSLAFFAVRYWQPDAARWLLFNYLVLALCGLVLVLQPLPGQRSE